MYGKHLLSASHLPIALLTLSLSLLPGAASAAGQKAFDTAMAPILKDYLSIQKTLASDSHAGASAAAARIAAKAKSLDASGIKGEHAKKYAGIPNKIAKGAAAVAKAKSLEATREAFKVLSKPMALWATLSEPKQLNIVYCSMAKGSWLQKPGGVRNPYYGKSMLVCGEVVGGTEKGSGTPHGKH